MFLAKNVVVATGLYQKPWIPIVVGSAQSGAQIVEELYQSGRKVYLSMSRTGRVPRRYRGSDIDSQL